MSPFDRELLYQMVTLPREHTISSSRFCPRDAVLARYMLAMALTTMPDAAVMCLYVLLTTPRLLTKSITGNFLVNFWMTA